MGARKYSLNWFINKFASIPHSKWTTGSLYTQAGACCALGHCGVRDYKETPEANALVDLLGGSYLVTVARVNDHGILYTEQGPIQFHQSTPKGRILGALRYVQRQSKQGKSKRKAVK